MLPYLSSFSNQDPNFSRIEIVVTGLKIIYISFTSLISEMQAAVTTLGCFRTTESTFRKQET